VVVSWHVLRACGNQGWRRMRTKPPRSPRRRVTLTPRYASQHQRNSLARLGGKRSAIDQRLRRYASRWRSLAWLARRGRWRLALDQRVRRHATGWCCLARLGGRRTALGQRRSATGVTANAIARLAYHITATAVNPAVSRTTSRISPTRENSFRRSPSMVEYDSDRTSKETRGGGPSAPPERSSRPRSRGRSPSRSPRSNDILRTGIHTSVDTMRNDSKNRPQNRLQNALKETSLAKAQTNLLNASRRCDTNVSHG